MMIKLDGVCTEQPECGVVFDSVGVVLSSVVVLEDDGRALVYSQSVQMTRGVKNGVVSEICWISGINVSFESEA